MPHIALIMCNGESEQLDTPWHIDAESVARGDLCGHRGTACCGSAAIFGPIPHSYGNTTAPVGVSSAASQPGRLDNAAVPDTADRAADIRGSDVGRIGI